MTRGPSQAVKEATEYLKLHPGTSADILAIKFGLNITTVYRSDWWKKYRTQKEAK